MIYKAVVSIAGIIVTLVGVSQFPDALTEQERIDPTTSTSYPADVQQSLLQKKIVSSKGFLIVLSGVSILGALILYIIVEAIYRTRENSVSITPAPS